MDAALKTWLWDDVDQALFMEQFSALAILDSFKATKASLATLGLTGVYALLRAERELLLKVRSTSPQLAMRHEQAANPPRQHSAHAAQVTTDFLHQLDSGRAKLHAKQQSDLAQRVMSEHPHAVPLPAAPSKKGEPQHFESRFKKLQQGLASGASRAAPSHASVQYALWHLLGRKDQLSHICYSQSPQEHVNGTAGCAFRLSRCQGSQEGPIGACPEAHAAPA